ncbi:S-adenosyl-L-methionine-dependent methyltransferase [Sphaerosporella brunnea]|uniref:S-adenosyl-L-methionine-dependent methyltransferase n=1 Tax=Sphaerosporella brunnea TaxID=1250544 RepID=A0A5J5EYT4_9PEZI|nr:S-adenosyl-L-methionine-dependent methyltransferase [Sphaerosporella brunnea]
MPLSAFLRPFLILGLSAGFAGITIAKLLIAGNIRALLSWRTFQSHWFANFWTLFGPISAGMDAHKARAAVGAAYGVVLDLGPGSGLTVCHFDAAKVTKIYGVEPCVELHAQLQQRVAEAGLKDVYQILPCGAEELAAYGIERESVDSVVCCKVLCGIPAPERVTKELYAYTKPGGQFLVWEHVRNGRCTPIRGFQRVLQFVWPHLLQGCNINRPTDEILRNAGKWDSVALGYDQEQSSWDPVPFVEGRLIKAKE